MGAATGLRALMAALVLAPSSWAALIVRPPPPNNPQVPAALLAPPPSARARGAFLARALRRRLLELEEQAAELRERYALDAVAYGAVAERLSREEPGSAAAGQSRAALARLDAERRKESAPLVLEAAVLALELERYRRGGDSPPEVPDGAAVRRALEDGAPASPPARRLELDLARLLRQLRAPEPRLPAAPVPARAPEAARSQAPAAAAPSARAASSPARGADPVPALVEQLSSPEPRRRALAADELAGRGAAAAPALPALRRALSDPDARVRASAALALAGVGLATEPILADVRRALQDRDEDVRFSARRALERLQR